MGKNSNAGFPPVQPKTYRIAFTGETMMGPTIAWGDSIFFANEGTEKYEIAALTGVTPGTTEGTPDPNNVWCTVAAGETSEPFVFTWQTGFSKDPVPFPFGTIPGTAKAVVTVQMAIPQN